MVIKLKSKAQKLLFIDIEKGNISINSQLLYKKKKLIETS